MEASTPHRSPCGARPRSRVQEAGLHRRDALARPRRDPDDTPISEAAELYADGELLEARAIVMDVVGDDLRCIDAHAHLGNWAFDVDPKRALVHYEIGVAIGELSLRTAPPDHVLPWAFIYNRPLLRARDGRGQALWRLERRAEAETVFDRMCALNPLDNQGARFCLLAVQDGKTWEEFMASDRAHEVGGRPDGDEDAADWLD